ncbi:MAG TPA: glycosyltransferase family 4 protein [Polyangiaceae bacterium]|nr:glycosyltransferase family 4 protein [Polyangiaceae bacterium]
MKPWVFVVPDRSGHPSGGTRYNTALLRELGAQGAELVIVPSNELGPISASHAEWIWVDSLYLSLVAQLAARARGDWRARVGILLHYLPSLLSSGNAALSGAEHEALQACDALVVTSEYMKAELSRRGYGAKPCAVVEPGCELTLAATAPDVTSLRALMVAHVVENKGVYELLRALATELSGSDELSLEIAGSLEVAPEYSRRCRGLLDDAPLLARSVTWLGTLDEDSTRRAYLRNNLFVSASRSESYGMALAEARTVGLPVIANAGGNVSALVNRRSGGRLCANADEVAVACVELARSASARAEVTALARAEAIPPRPWARVAEEFTERVAQFR